jgi:hypothetical protein
MRQRITHHLWEDDPQNPKNLWSKSVRDPALRLEPFNVQKLRELGRAHRSGDLRPQSSVESETGTVEVLNENLSDDDGKPQPFVSRALLLAFGEKDRNSRDHPLKKRPASKRRSSSKA